MRIQESKYKERPAVVLESDALIATFLPQDGGKMASLRVRKSGKELLVTKKEAEYKVLKYDGDYVSSECSGFDDNGVFKLEHKLSDLMAAAESYAKEKGYLTFRSGISSIGFNIHGQDIVNIPDAIANLQCDRIDYLWYLEHGFKVIGIQPNAYENGFHLILLAKDLS